jgi:5-formyltetrahydrofolate cyclo-ligase
MLEKRKALSKDECKDKSLLIQQKLISTEEYCQSKVIVLYSSIHNEVETHLVIRDALLSGKRVFLPAVCAAGLLFRELPDSLALRKGRYGILEPDESNSVIDPKLADIIVLPGLAFDMEGRRIGYGKGYYDKALHKLEGTGKLVAVCYDFQLVDDIVGEPHDVRVDMIITESMTILPPAECSDKKW